MIIFNRIDARNIQIIAARTKVVLDLIGVAGANGADNVIGEAIGKCRVKALQISTAFKEVGVNQVHIQGILFNMLPVEAGFPGIFLRGRTIDQALSRPINRPCAANANANLISLDLILLGTIHPRE